MDAVQAKFGTQALKKASLDQPTDSPKYLGDQKVTDLCAVHVNITGSRVQGVCFRHETHLAARDHGGVRICQKYAGRVCAGLVPGDPGKDPGDGGVVPERCNFLPGGSGYR